MKIENIDHNFRLRQSISAEDLTVYDVPSQYFSLYGVYFEERANTFVRMDTRVAARVSEGVDVLCRHTAGGRLCFTTDSSMIKIAVEYSEFNEMSHMPVTGSGGFSLFELTKGGEKYITNFAPIHQADKTGFAAGIQLGEGGMRNYVLYFPLYNRVDKFSVALDAKASVQPLKPYRSVLPILYYGSSITQGGCASRPDHAYQALICKKNNIDFINLGFSGNALAEKEMVSYLGGVDCSLFVCDYDHNAPTAEYLAETHYPLYKAYRKARPDTPILFISRPDFYRTEDGVMREKVIRATYMRARKDGDNNVYFLSGKSFYGKRPSWEFAVDGCHPTDYGFAVMADKIYKKMLTVDKKFGEGKYD